MLCTAALDLLRKTQGSRRGGARKRRGGPCGSGKRLEKRLRGAMRTARRASNVEVPSFLRQLAKETEKMVTFFFKGGPRERDPGEDRDSDGEEAAPSPYLDRPILEKVVAEGGCERGTSYAVASMQGWRSSMEDAHTCLPTLKGPQAGWSYYAVFDGHAGSSVAQYCSRNLLEHIMASGRSHTHDHI